MIAVLITPRGERQEAIPRNGVAFTVRELQDMVDGYIDIVDIDDELVMVFDVDGNEKDKLFNKKATEILRKAHEGEPDFGDFVSGNAVVCKNHMIKP